MSSMANIMLSSASAFLLRKLSALRILSGLYKYCCLTHPHSCTCMLTLADLCNAHVVHLLFMKRGVEHTQSPMSVRGIEAFRVLR